MIRQDISFLEKFVKKEVFFEDSESFHESIINEIARILSSKLRSRNDQYSFGIQDTFSLDKASDNLKEFAKHCSEKIIKFEPRVSDIEINKISFDKTKQHIILDIVCFLRTYNHFSFNLKI